MRHRRPLPMLILLWGLSLAPTSAAYAGPPYPSPTQPARPAPWAEIRIEWPADALLEELRRWPDLEILSARRDEPLRAVVPAPAVEELRRRGFQVEVVAADLEEFYSSRLAAGQFGAYHTLSEIRNTLDSLHLAHPDITTERFPISTTYEGREVWALRVSDNPLLEEGEPEILIDALHHAREPMSAEVLLHYLAYLCDNYGTDPVVTFLVDEREIWFLPLVNPDGYYYNEVNYPNGGGMWRKNRRPVLECFGVDLNRNYTYWWGGEGSSADPCDLLYRGPGPGSEPEVQGVMALMMGHEFDIYHTFHSYGEQVLIPWCYTGFHTPDDALFREVGAEMARYNGYEVGQPAEILPQGCSGTSIDYAYGEIGEKNRIFAFITEVGGDDFWPPAVLIEPVCADNLYGNLYLTQVAGSYLRVDDSWLGGDGRADPGETVDLFVTLRNHGVNEGVSPAELILRTQDSYLRLHTARVPYGDLSPRLERTNSNYPLVFEVDPACPPGHEALLTFELWGSDMTYPPDSLNLTLGIPPMVYYQSFETGSDWTTDPSHTASTGTFVRVDPNPTAYQPGDDTSEPGTYCLVTGQNVSLGIEDVDGGISAVRSPSIDLSMVPLATLKANYFFGQRDLGDDPAGDFFRLQLSNDGGGHLPADTARDTGLLPRPRMGRPGGRASRSSPAYLGDGDTNSGLGRPRRGRYH